MDKRIPLIAAICGLAAIAGLASLSFVNTDSEPIDTPAAANSQAPPKATLDNPTRHRRASERAPRNGSPPRAGGPPSSNSESSHDADGDDFEATTFAPDMAGIQAAVAERMPELSACYETHLANQPGATGRLVMAIQLAPEGTSSKIDTVNIGASDIDATMMQGCIATALEELRFEAVPQPTVMTMPLIFDAN